MRRRLPALGALRAFASAGRHLSFQKAARELAVTPAAISHQIRHLEEDLGVKLFRRLVRKLQLTDSGQTLLPDVAAAFDRLGAAIDRWQAREHSGPLTITALPTFTYRWLAPRLQRFQAAHAEFEIRVEVSGRLHDFIRDDADVGIRHGFGSWPGVEAIQLFEDRFTPLIARRVLESGTPLKNPADLLRYPLLREIGPEHQEWEIWFRAAGVVPQRFARAAMFDSSQLAVQAALSGLGVALVHPDFFREEIGSGELVQPFPIEGKNGKSYYFVHAEGRGDRPKIAAFRAWLLDEIAAFKAEAPQRKRATARRKASAISTSSR